MKEEEKMGKDIKNEIKKELESGKKLVYLVHDETWPGRGELINDSLIDAKNVLIVLKEEMLKKECLNLNLKDSLMLLQSLHLMISRAVMALNINKEHLLKAYQEAGSQKKFEHFLTLQPKVKKGDFCTRIVKNLFQNA